MSNAMQGSIGSLVALWRYPVKSMMGEELNAAEVTERGLLGDRAYALVDTSRRESSHRQKPAKWPHLFDFRATFVEPVRSPASVPSVRIVLPDGATVTSDQRDLNQTLSKALNREVTGGRGLDLHVHDPNALWRLTPAKGRSPPYNQASVLHRKRKCPNQHHLDHLRHPSAVQDTYRSPRPPSQP